MEITDDLIKEFVGGQKKDSSYNAAVDYANHLSFHYDGFDLRSGIIEEKPVNPYFAHLILERRITEPKEIMEYRAKIYKSKTKAATRRVHNALKKIKNAEDWHVRFPDLPSGIKKEDSLETYMAKAPVVGSYENWLFTIGLKNTMKAPNAVRLTVDPLQRERESNERVTPIPIIIEEANVYEFSKHKNILICKSPFVIEVISAGKKERVEPTWFVNEFVVVQAFEDPNTKALLQEVIITHDTGHVPATKIGGELETFYDNSPFYKSLIDPMLVDLDEAAREYSDVQAAVVQHMHPLFWSTDGQECPTCSGTKKMHTDYGSLTTCTQCGGKGKLSFSPFQHMEFSNEFGSETQNPFPHAGYIKRDTDIIELQDRRVNAHIMDALASVNMQFLADVPLNQSGKAKEVDREDLNTFVLDVARHLVVEVWLPMITDTAIQRYPEVKTEEILPSVKVPQNVNLLTSAHLIKQISQAQEAGVDRSILKELNVQLAATKFSAFPEIKRKVITAVQQDPFNLFKGEEITDMGLARTAASRDITLHNYIDAFMEQAMQENDGFDLMPYKEQKAILSKLTDAKLIEINADIIRLDTGNTEPD